MSFSGPGQSRALPGPTGPGMGPVSIVESG